MRKSTLIYLSRVAIYASIGALASLSVRSAQAANFTYTSSVSVASPNVEPGITGQDFYLNYTAATVTPPGPAVPTGIESIKLGSFQSFSFGTGPYPSTTPDPNVTPTFTITVNTTGLSGNPTATFTGTLTLDTALTNEFHTDEYDLDFTPGTNYYWTTDPNGAGNFVFQDVGSCSSVTNAGCYSIGIETGVPVNKLGGTTNVWAFIAPASVTTPEPASLALTGLAFCGLFSLGLRKKLQAARS